MTNKTRDRMPILITAIYARDWTINHECVAVEKVAESLEKEAVGWVVGFVVVETHGAITLTMQWFDDDMVRCTVTVPKACIIRRYDREVPPDAFVESNEGSCLSV